jgi:acetolactate synthase-1/2/3 large subunit
MVAEAYGMPGLYATTQSQAREVIARARSYDGPVLCEFLVEREVNVFPMVLPGNALEDMARRQPVAQGTGYGSAK